MSSLLDVRLGAQEPVIQHLPPDVHSLAAAEEAIELADAYLICDGNPLAESQKTTLRGACGERADGSWAASRIGDFGPRQGTGKNDKIAARELAGLVLFGERLQIHTAHEFPTANESFLRMVAIFEAWDDLRKRVARIRYANGEQGIELLTGQRLKYRARTGGSGRGFAKADLIVYDEAQHLARSHVAASGPAKLANPNSQSWYAGSGGFSTSAVAWELRRAAILGTGGRLAYTEATGEAITVVDGHIVAIPPNPDDRDVWYRSMPGLGRWVTEEAMEALRDELGADFSREGLCVWDPEPGASGAPRWLVVDEDAWFDCADTDSRASGPVGYAVAVSLDGAWSSVAASDGTHGEIVANRPGTSWVVDGCVDRGIEQIALNPSSPANVLIQPLERAGITVVKLKPAEYAQACGSLMEAVKARRFRHLGQTELDTAASLAQRRDSGGAWCWSQRLSPGDISPLVAVTQAAHVAQDAYEGPLVATT